MHTNTRRFEGKVAVITGAAGKIGRAAAARLAREGAAVVLVDLPGSGLEDAASEVRQHTQDVLAVGADVTSSRDVERYVSDAVMRDQLAAGERADARQGAGARPLRGRH